MKKFFLISISILSFHFLKAQDTIIKYSGDILRVKVTEITPTEIKYKKFEFQDGPTYVDKKTDILIIKYANGLKEHFDRAPSNPVQNNSGNTSTDYYNAQGPAVLKDNNENKITEWGTKYRTGHGYISERQMHNLMMDTKDKHIMGLVQNAKQAHTMQFLGFVGIPLGVIAGVCMIESLTYKTTYNAQTGYYQRTQNPNKTELQTVAGICAVVAVACPIFAGVSKYRRSNYNREAIKLYNQRF